MLTPIKKEILKEKEIKEFTEDQGSYSPEKFVSHRIPKVTVHGRFQPPLHINHFYTYLSIAFQIAQKVVILITNPKLSESKVNESPHRSAKENNPFTYEERVEIFSDFFKNINIPKERFECRPFMITDEKEWEKVLEKDTPNLINTYGEWSEKKLSNFKKLGYKTIHSSFPKLANVSGTAIRKIITKDLSNEEKKSALIEGGLMPEAVDKVIEIHNKKQK